MQKNLIDKRLLTLYDKNIKYTGSILNKNTTYKENDIISFEGAILKVTVAGTTDSTLKAIRTFLTTAKTGDTIVSGTATLKLMSLTDDIVIEDWKTKTNYTVNNVVINDKKIYRCTTAHTSTNTFDEAKWEEISALENTVRPWATKTDYKANDLIYIDNVLYKCNTAHTSTTFSADVSKWDNMCSNIRDFASNTFYKNGSYVLYNNNIYKALKDTTEYIGDHDWQKITNTQKPSIETWKTGTEYKKNEVVVYNEKIYKCAVDHTSGTDFSVDKPKYWESLSDNPIINDWISGNNYEVGTCVIKSNQNGIVDWTASKQYNVNDEVVYNGYIYTCKTQNTDAEFTETNWEVKEPVYNRIYRCIKNTNNKTFDESEWQLINGDSKATVDEVDKLLA